MKKIIYIFLIVLISSIILINIFSIFNISLFGFRTFKIASGSMKPKYDINDLIVVKNKDNYKVNDVVTYKNASGEYVTHRIIKKDGNLFTLKGDYNNTEDKEIEKKDIVGKVIFKSKILKIANRLFTSTIFWLIMPMVFIVIMFLPSRKENDTK